MLLIHVVVVPFGLTGSTSFGRNSFRVHRGTDHDDVIKLKHFRVIGPLWGESTGDSLTKTSDAELWCFRCSAPEQTLTKQARRRWFETPSRILWRHCNVKLNSHQPLLLTLANEFRMNEIIKQTHLIAGALICASIWLIAWWQTCPSFL